MTQEEFCLELDEMFEVKPGTISLDNKLSDFPNWDSLRFLGLISFIDSEYGITLKPKFVTEAGSIREIYDFVEGGAEKSAA